MTFRAPARKIFSREYCNKPESTEIALISQMPDFIFAIFQSGGRSGVTFVFGTQRCWRSSECILILKASSEPGGALGTSDKILSATSTCPNPIALLNTDNHGLSGSV
jgi:hypothetical protein